jgi:hypothetical protein
VNVGNLSGFAGKNGSAGEISGIQRVILSEGKPSFQTILDDVCERLQGTMQQGSLRRIQKLEESLRLLEEELNELASCVGLAANMAACPAETLQEG